VDLKALRWDAEQLRLSGTSLLVGGDPYVVRIYVPEGLRPLGEAVSWRPPLAELRLKRPENGPVDWHVDFTSG